MSENSGSATPKQRAKVAGNATPPPVPAPTHTHTHAGTMHAGGPGRVVLRWGAAVVGASPAGRQLAANAAVAVDVDAHLALQLVDELLHAAEGGGGAIGGLLEGVRRGGKREKRGNEVDS